MSDDAIGRGTLGAGDGAVPTGADVPVSEVAKNYGANLLNP